MLEMEEKQKHFDLEKELRVFWIRPIKLCISMFPQVEAYKILKETQYENISFVFRKPILICYSLLITDSLLYIF